MDFTLWIKNMALDCVHINIRKSLKSREQLQLYQYKVQKAGSKLEENVLSRIKVSFKYDLLLILKHNLYYVTVSLGLEAEASSEIYLTRPWHIAITFRL